MRKQVIVIILSFISAIAFAQTEKSTINLNKLGSYTQGPCYDITNSGNYLFITNGYNIDIMDISNPVSPEFIYRIPANDYIYDLKCKDNFLYYALGDEGLMIYDISNPLNPEFISNFSLDAGIYYIGFMNDYVLLVHGDHFYYISVLQSGVSIFDFSNKASPQNLHYFKSAGYAPILAVSGEIVFLHTSVGLEIVNFGDINNPISKRYSTDYSAIDFYGNNILGSTGSKVRVFTMNENLEIAYLNEISFNHSVTDLVINNDVLYTIHHEPYTANNKSTLSLFDLTDPISPKILHSYLMQCENKKMLGNNNYLYSANSNGLFTLNISDDQNILQESFYSTGNWSSGEVVVKDNFLFMSTGIGGVTILDISNPESPEYFDRIDCFAVSSKIKDNYFFVSNGNESIWIYNIADMNAIKVVNTMEMSTFEDFFVQNNFLYTSETSYSTTPKFTKLHAYNIDNADSPYFLRTIEINNIAGFVRIEDGVLSIRSSKKLYIYSFSPELDPIILDTVQIFGNRNYIVDYIIAGNNLYLYSGWGEFSTYSKTKSGFEKNGDYFIEEFASNDMVYKDNLIFMTDRGEQRIIAIDVEDVENPFISGESEYDENFYNTALTAFENKLFVTRDGPFDIFSIEEIEVTIDIKPDSTVTIEYPNIYELKQNYPNPFNSSTRINYSLPEDGNVTLEIFNSLGQEIFKVLDEEKLAGYYEFEFFAPDNLSSGVYYFKLTSQNYSKTKKMIYLK
jgi:hypothetical protein